MTTTRLRYTNDELVTDPPYARRIERDGVLLHGAHDADGGYLPPRSTLRVPAIAAWTDQLAAAGQPSRVIEPDAVRHRRTPLRHDVERPHQPRSTSPVARPAAANCPEHAIRLDP